MEVNGITSCKISDSLRMRQVIALLVAFLIPSFTKGNAVDNFQNETDPSVRPEGRVFNGYNAPLGALPFMVWIEIECSNMYPNTCGGTLIDPQWVVSAAHCFMCESPNANLYLGFVDRRNLGSALSIKSSDIWIHPDFGKFGILNDIALVKINQGVTLTNTINVIRLPHFNTFTDFQDGSTALISGWGLTNSGQPSPFLNYKEVRILPKEHCYQYMLSIGSSLSDKELCTEHFACKGDSGGPLIYFTSEGYPILIGIISSYRTMMGLPIICGMITPTPTIHVNVALYLNWISNVTAININ